MLQSVIVRNFKGETLELELAHPEKTGLLVYNIEGIGGAAGSVNTSDTATGDGAWYNSARIDTRNITVSLKLMQLPEQSVEDSRHLMYRYFPIKKQLRLTFITDRRSVYIDGYVESNETPIFASQENSQISIICPDPHFYSVEDANNFTGEPTPLFEFPFCDNSVVLDTGDDGQPDVYWQDNLIDNFDFSHVKNDSGEEAFYHTGETVNDWFVDVGLLGNAAVSLQINAIRFRSYPSNTNPASFYTNLGPLASKQSYTVSFIDETNLYSTTFVWDREGTSQYEQTFDSHTENVIMKVVADEGSEDARFELSIDALTGGYKDLYAVKVEQGSEQSLADKVDGKWVFRTKPEPKPDPTTKNIPTLQFGIPGEEIRLFVDYSGSDETGMVISFVIKTAPTELTITNVNTYEFFKIDISKVGSILGRAVAAGDIIEISTYRGDKRITAVSGVQRTDVTGGIVKGSTWLQLTPGTNMFETNADSGEVETTISSRVVHAGV